MDKNKKIDLFENNKDKLIAMVQSRLESGCLNETESESLGRLLKAMNKYTFINRNKMKGVITRMLIDSLTIDYTIGEKLIEFDNQIK